MQYNVCLIFISTLWQSLSLSSALKTYCATFPIIFNAWELQEDLFNSIMSPFSKCYFWIYKFLVVQRLSSASCRLVVCILLSCRLHLAVVFAVSCEIINQKSRMPEIEVRPEAMKEENNYSFVILPKLSHSTNVRSWDITIYRICFLLVSVYYIFVKDDFRTSYVHCYLNLSSNYFNIYKTL